MDLLVPPHYWYGVANTLWVAVRCELITRAAATEMLDSLLEFHLIVWPVEAAVCLDLSFQLGLAVYDSAYLAWRWNRAQPSGPWIAPWGRRPPG